MLRKYTLLKILFLFLFFFLTICFQNRLEANTIMDIPGLFNTGVDEFGNPGPVSDLGIDIYELHYQLTGTYDTLVIKGKIEWVSPGGVANWIAPTGPHTSDASGDYIYELIFDLNGLDPGTAEIKGEWATDYNSEIYLNGNPTGNILDDPNHSYKILHDFYINSGFMPGINTMQFIAHHTDSSLPTALMVQNLKGKANAVPEPATILLFLSSLVALAIVKRKLKS
ncbi:MAG: PEP-CTERM sorting domain-containing protein [bacterium]